MYSCRFGEAWAEWAENQPHGNHLHRRYYVRALSASAYSLLNVYSKRTNRPPANDNGNNNTVNKSSCRWSRSVGDGGENLMYYLMRLLARDKILISVAAYGAGDVMIFLYYRNAALEIV